MVKYYDAVIISIKKLKRIALKTVMPSSKDT